MSGAAIGHMAWSGASRDGVAEPAEVRLLPLTHHLKVQGLLAEVALRCGVGLQLQARLLPGLHQLLCNAQETDRHLLMGFLQQPQQQNNGKEIWQNSLVVRVLVTSLSQRRVLVTSPQSLVYGSLTPTSTLKMNILKLKKLMSCIG